MNIFADYPRHQDCVNEHISICDICYKCGKCGRIFENGFMIQQAKDEKELEDEE